MCKKKNKNEKIKRKKIILNRAKKAISIKEKTNVNT